MESLPASLAERLRELTYNERAVAYLQVDAALTLVGAGGHLENYGLAAIRLGEPAVEQAFFLEGLLPLEETPYFVPSVELDCGRAADLHFYLDAGTVWVVLLDVTASRNAARRVLQKAHEITLLEEKEAQLNRRLEDTNRELELRNRFIRETFGRYLTDEVVSTLLESPTGPQIGGEKRKITMMMADLRGFTSLSERLAPERVVTILNRYLTAMVKIIKQHHGTTDEFIGDAIFVLFGAPIWQEDDAQRAIACAVQMQLAMASVNEQNRQEGLPEVEMGIGIHTGLVVVGNIGSTERMKYGVVGSQVNLTSRIQSCTTGGQILISEATRQELAPILKLGKQIEIEAKGIEHPVTLSDVLGIGGPHRLFLPERAETLIILAEEIPFMYEIVEASHLGGEIHKGKLTKLSLKAAEARLETRVPNLSNLKMRLIGPEGQETRGTLYAKVVGEIAGSGMDFSLRFTSLSREAETLFRVVQWMGVVPTVGGAT